MSEHIKLDPQRLSALILRFGLLGNVLLCWHAATRLWESGDMVRQTPSVILSMVNYLAAFLFLILVCRRSILQKAAWIIPLAPLLVYLSYAQIHHVNQEQFGGPLTTDGFMFSDYATYLLEIGENPYSHDLLDAYRVNRASGLFSTPLLKGDVTGRAPYPALSFLLFMPYRLLGISTTLVYPTFLLLTMTAIYWFTPSVFRPVILLPFFIAPEFLLYTLGTVGDIVWAFFLVMLVGQWQQARWRGIWFGLACASKQHPWFLAPYLLIRLWRESREKQLTFARSLVVLTEFTALSVGTFLLFNLPFMVWNFNSWWLGVNEPLFSSMIILGQGLSSLTMLGIVFIPRVFFTLFVFGGFAFTLWMYWRHFDQYRESLWILPAIFLWFGHRSLTSYWYFSALPFMLALVRNLPSATTPEEEKPISWRPSFAIIGAALVVIIVLISSALRSPTLEIKVIPPILSSGNITQLEVEVYNNSDQIVSPRFSVQSWSNQPLFWDIDHGPETLDPGQRERYAISTDLPYEQFDTTKGAQIIVTDDDNYDLRGSTLIQGDLDLVTYPNTLANGKFQYWNPQTNAPLLWGVIADELDVVELMTPVGDDPDAVLRFTINNPSDNTRATVMLDTWIAFPTQPVQVWVKPPASANHIPELDIVYGLELLSTFNKNRVWVLFGDDKRSGQISDDLSYWMMPAPRDVWSLQELDVAQIFADANLVVSDPTRMQFGNLDFPVGMLNFRLLFAARDPESWPVVAEFGPVHSVEEAVDKRQLVEETVEYPEYLLVWRGDINRRARNYELAEQFYRDALVYNPQFAPAYYGLGEVQLNTNVWQAAAESFEIALTLDYDWPGLAHKGLGWAYLHLDDPQRSLDEFQIAVNIMIARTPLYKHSDFADAYEGMGWLYLDQNYFSQAELLFDRALYHDPYSPEAITGLERAREALVTK